MERIPLSRKQIIKLKQQNELHFKSNLQQLFAMIPKSKVVKKNGKTNL